LRVRATFAIVDVPADRVSGNLLHAFGMHMSTELPGLADVSGLAHCRFVNFYGEPAPRLARTQTMYPADAPRRPKIVNLISPILFFESEALWSQIQDLFVDGVINDRHWKVFIDQLQGRWRELLLLVSGLLRSSRIIN
jgi:hypothetical protein